MRNAGKGPSATCELSDPDQSAYPRSLIRAFFGRRFILQYPLILVAGSEVPDQTAQMRSLVWDFVARIYDKSLFHMLQQNYVRKRTF